MAEILTFKLNFFHFFPHLPGQSNNLSFRLSLRDTAVHFIKKEGICQSCSDLQVFSKNLTQLLKGKKLEKNPYP